MKIWEFLSPDRIVLDATFSDKDQALLEAARLFADSGVVSDGDALYRGMAAREALMSTGVGNGIGIPHAAGSYVLAPAVALLRVSPPIGFDALDKKPVDLLIAVVVPENEQRTHLSLLAGVARLCKTTKFLSSVRKAGDPAKLYSRIKALEKKMAFH